MSLCQWNDKRYRADKVNQPSHYKLEGLDYECIQLMEMMLTEEEFKGFLKGNIFKYIFRHDKKNGKEDLKKANVYAGMLDEELRRIE